ncbi:MAG: sigma 54-interacting transcriptional regulator [Pirellulales bacterium]
MQQNSQSAYLIIRLGSRWNDVFRLEPALPLVIGRASQNPIVVADERCSRNHAEIRNASGRWVVRDLGSRNGTLVNGTTISGEVELQEGDTIQVASCQMTFVRSLGQAFRTPTEDPSPTRDDQRTLEHSEPQTITHRRREASWLKRAPMSEQETVEESQSAMTATELFRLSYDLAKELTPESAAQLALDRLLQLIKASAGGVLRVNRREKEDGKAFSLSLLATRERQGKAYHRINDFLADTVMREGQAILARNIQDDSQLIDPQASAVRQTTSVICAPIRDSKQVDGLLHVYSSNDELMLGPNQLEIAIAVAETLGIALLNLRSTQKLSQKLKDSQRQIQSLQAQIGETTQLLGSSSHLAKLRQQITRVGPTSATVLIRGESGCGKEVTARAIHKSSSRKDGPFIALNCAALSPTLLESELFGHEKGSFTGATERKIGKFELADRGTLMLDEIGEMSPEIQAKFLRVLEGKPFERVGGSKQIQVDVRVIAATNRDLETAVKEGHFRADLYFRLRVIELTVPPLRDRKEDILPLADHFLAQFVDEIGHGPKGFSPRAQKAMLEYAWPGNIRELKNAIERAVVLATGSLAEPEDLALSHLILPHSVVPPPVFDWNRSLEDVEREHILAVLEANHGHKSKTASILGIERSTLDRKLKKYGIDSSDDETKS